MERDNVLQIVILIIAVVALILASVSMLEEDEEHEDEDNGDGDNIPPTAVIKSTAPTIEMGAFVGFNGSGSSDSDGIIIEYIWDFGDGLKDSGMYSTYYYSSPGTYTITLTVIDDEKASDKESWTITVLPNDSPVAIITVKTNTTETGEFIYFNASNSMDSDGRIIEYTWDFGDGTKDSGMYTSHVYALQGLYSVYLTVTDNDGATDSDIVDVTVNYGGENGGPENLPPVSKIDTIDQQAVEDETFSIIGINSSDPDGIIIQYLWYIDDVIWDDGMITTYNFQTPGPHNVTLMVIDNGGASNKSTLTIDVIPRTPSISMIWNEDPQEPGNYTGYIVSISGSYSINTYDVTVSITHGNESDSKELNEIAVSSLIVGDLTFYYNDLTPTMKLGAEDIFTIVGGVSGDKIRFIFIPSGGQMCQTTLP